MFIIDNESGIVYRNQEAFLMKLEGGKLTFDGGTPDFSVLKDKFGSCRDLTESGRVKSLSGAFTYVDKNAYGQVQFEGKAGAGDKLAAVALGTYIDMSDSDLVLINMTSKELFAAMLPFMDEQMGKLSGFFHKKDRKALEPLYDYIREKAQ